jgi:protein-disulfide isomerase
MNRLAFTVAALALCAAPLGAQKTKADSMRVDSLLARADAGRIQGATNATLWVIEMSDFQCPYCKRWHDEVYPVIKREYVDKGLVRMAYLQFPLDMHPHAEPAAVASMCAAEQNRFWPVHDKLFQTQDRWKNLQSSVIYFDSLAVAAGVDAKRWRDCVREGHVRRIVNADMARAMNFGVRSTPTFLVGNKVIQGAQPVDSFRIAINSQLAKPGTKPPR